MRFYSATCFIFGLNLSIFTMAAVPVVLNGSYQPAKNNNQQCLRGVPGALRVRINSENCILFEGRVKGHWEEAIALCEVNNGEVKKTIEGSMPGIGKTSILLTTVSKVDDQGVFFAEYGNTEKAFDGTQIVSILNTSIKGRLVGKVLKIDFKESGDADFPSQSYACEYKRE